jgi:DNA-binding CsgD family transcriptional regulator
MGAVEHLKTLCCLGLPPESAMIAVTPLLHEIIPHGWCRMALLKPDATIASGYSENPKAASIHRESMWRFMDDPTSPASLWYPAFRNVAIGWSLHKQGRGWLDSGWYREVEAPLDSCWLLSGMIGEGRQSIAFVGLTRPRSARVFTVDDVQRLDQLRPWLGHAFHSSLSDAMGLQGQGHTSIAGAPVQTGQMVLKADANVLFQTPGIELLLDIIDRKPANYTSCLPVRDGLPAPILKLLSQIAGTTNGASAIPPRIEALTAHGVLSLEATWLMPANTNPVDVAKDPKSCLISVTIELREHALAHAARVLRESGATPAQMKIGIQLAMGKSKPAIADALGIQPSSVASLAKKLYETLDIHSSTELATKIWRNEKTGEAQRSALPISLANSAKKAKSSLIYRT